MRTAIIYFLFLLTLACQTHEPTVPAPIIIPDTPETVEGEPYSYTSQSKNIALRFNIRYFPAEYKTVELVWGGTYQGYFDLNDLIYLPLLEGRQALDATFSDIYGDVVYKKTYWLNIGTQSQEKEEQKDNVYYYY